jgi:integrase
MSYTVTTGATTGNGDMAGNKVKFTDNQVKGLKAKDRQYELFESGGRGEGRFGVRVESSGKKTFIFRYFWQGKRMFMVLGRYETSAGGSKSDSSGVKRMGLLAARNKSTELSEIVKQGIDPKQKLIDDNKRRLEEQRELENLQKIESMQGDIEHLFISYTNAMKLNGKRTHAAVLKSLKAEVFPLIPKETKAKRVTVNDIKLVLAKMIQRDAIVQSNRVRSYMHAAFAHGLKHDNDPVNMEQSILFGIESNPVSVIPRQAYAEKIGETWLKLQELQHLLDTFQSANKIGWQVDQLLKFIVHTGGQRPYEIVTEQWEYINWEQNTLLVPVGISKNKLPHIIPLTQTVIKLLDGLRLVNGSSPFIFPKYGNDSEHMLTSTLAKAMSYYRKQYPDFTYAIPRDIRRTCKTLMGEAGLSKDIRDRVQNHKKDDVSSKHYDRYDYLDEKRHALKVWESKLINAKYTGNIAELKQA